MTVFFVTTLDQAVAFWSVVLYFLFELAFYALNIARSSSVRQSKIVNAFWVIIVVVLLVLCVAGAVELVKLIVG